MGSGRESEAVNAVVKYLLFFFNFIFWLIGCALIGVGSWAYIEKNRFYHNDIQSIYDVLFDVSIGVLVVGSIIFIIAFAGCLGALRENIILLKIFAYMLGILFLLEVVGAILIFVFSGQGQEEVSKLFREEGIVRYRDDPDFQSIFDWVQETFHCCGVGHKGYREWSMNIYFNCSDTNPSPERCAVPYSCCKQPTNVITDHKDLMCGYGVQKLGYLEASERVYIVGCVQAVIDEARQNLYILGGVALSLAVPQIMGPILACWLIYGININRESAIKQPGLLDEHNKPASRQPRDLRPVPVAIDYGDKVVYLDPPPPKPVPVTKEVFSLPQTKKGPIKKVWLSSPIEPASSPVEPALSPVEPVSPQMKLLFKLAPMRRADPLAEYEDLYNAQQPLSLHHQQGGDYQEMTYNVPVKSPRSKVVNPLMLPPIARVGGLGIVKKIIAAKQRVKRSAMDDGAMAMEAMKVDGNNNRELVIVDSGGQAVAAAAATATSGRAVASGGQAVASGGQAVASSGQTAAVNTGGWAKAMVADEEIQPLPPPHKMRIYPQHELREMCTPTDFRTLDLSVLTPQEPSSNLFPSNRVFPSHRESVTSADIHHQRDEASRQPQQPATMLNFAQMQEVLKNILKFENCAPPPTASTNITEDPLAIPRPQFYPPASTAPAATTATTAANANIYPELYVQHDLPTALPYQLDYQNVAVQQSTVPRPIQTFFPEAHHVHLPDGAHESLADTSYVGYPQEILQLPPSRQPSYPRGLIEPKPFVFNQRHMGWESRVPVYSVRTASGRTVVLPCRVGRGPPLYQSLY